MKYAWIERHKRQWPVCVQCRVLEVSASGYRQHLARRSRSPAEGLIFHSDRGSQYASHRYTELLVIGTLKILRFGV